MRARSAKCPYICTKWRSTIHSRENGVYFRVYVTSTSDMKNRILILLWELYLPFVNASYRRLSVQLLRNEFVSWVIRGHVLHAVQPEVPYSWNDSFPKCRKYEQVGKRCAFFVGFWFSVFHWVSLSNLPLQPSFWGRKPGTRLLLVVFLLSLSRTLYGCTVCPLAIAVIVFVG